jgi:hypothetical protein
MRGRLWILPPDAPAIQPGVRQSRFATFIDYRVQRPA